jgi:lactoylglutathione lyase
MDPNPLAGADFGINLFVEHFDEAVRFYRDVLGLPVYRKTANLVGFRLAGETYLLIERDGYAAAGEKDRQQNPVVLRWDVPDRDATVTALEGRGARFVDRASRFPWGTIAVLLDPDGNRIEIGELSATSVSRMP